MPLMLQRPSPTSKPRVNKKYLTDRLVKWAGGNLDALISEGREIQLRLTRKAPMKKEETKTESFVRLMSVGKIPQAMNYVNVEKSVSGVHKFSAEILNDL